MPEWPEMETYRTLLNERLCGSKITNVVVGRAKTVNEPAEMFCQQLLNRSILYVERRGKFLNFHLDDGNRLLLHLMLGGWLAYGPEGPKPDDKFEVIVAFDTGSNLYFGGLKLGYLHRLSAKQVKDKWKDLGPEPLDPWLTPDRFYTRLKSFRSKLKPVLTNQKLTAGIGNCYSDEICFDAGVHPATAIAALDRETSDRVHASMHKVLQEAFASGGYMDHPLTADDKLTGGYDDKCRVYDRGGEPCVRCGTPIEKDELSGRKMFYCPHCQRL